MKRIARALSNIVGVFCQAGAVNIIADDMPEPGQYHICVDVQSPNLARLTLSGGEKRAPADSAPDAIVKHNPRQPYADSSITFPTSDDWISVHKELPPDKDVYVVAWCGYYKRPVVMYARILRIQKQQMKMHKGMGDKILRDPHKPIIMGGYFATHWKYFYGPE